MSGAEFVLPAPRPAPPAAPLPAEEGERAAAEGSLTRRATLTAAASLLDYVVKVIVHLLLTPILVRGLGSALYGVWEMLSRLSAYMTATDGRATEALRLIIAQHQGAADAGVRRRHVGAALVVWLVMLPLTLAIGAALVWLVAPRIVHVPAAQMPDVQRTIALLIGAMIATSLGAVPESALRGMNLGFKRMGVQAALNVLGGALAALAVWQGLGLMGVGGSVVVRAALTGLVFFSLARRHVPAFGADRPTAHNVRMVFGMSMWLSAGDLIAKLLLASDVLVLGAIAGPAVVAAYALTGYAARTAIGVHVFTAGAAVPGIGGLLGAGQQARAAHARRELLLLTWLFATVAGTVILLWNRPFLALWVGEQQYAGALVNLLIVLGAAQTAFIRTDAYLLDAALRPRARVLVGAGAALLTVAACAVLTLHFGLAGLCVGVLVGRAVQSVGYPWLARTSLGSRAREAGGWPLALRLTATTALLYGLALGAGDALGSPPWLWWGLGAAASVPASGALALLLGPDPGARRLLVTRLVALARVRTRP